MYGCMLDSRLRYLMAVARSGSFTGAAHAVGVSQSAITRSIADLETEIGFSIFYRTARGVVLTERGRDFVDRVGRLLEDARLVLNGSGTKEDPYAGVLRIGVAPASLDWWLMGPLVELLKRHPSIRYDISSSNFETIIHMLRSGSLDVAVGFEAAFSEWADLRRDHVGSLEGALFVRKDHPLLSQKNITAKHLADYDFVSSSESRPYFDVIRDLYEEGGVDWHFKVHRLDFFPLARQIVSMSDAIGIVSLSIGDVERFKQQFAILSDVDILPVSRLCCAYRDRWEPKPAARAFIGIVKRRFAAA